MLKSLAGHLGAGPVNGTADLQLSSKSITSYAAPVWSTNASDLIFNKIQTAHNAALRKDEDWGSHDGQYLPSSPGVPHAESQGPLRNVLCAMNEWHISEIYKK